MALYVVYTAGSIGFILIKSAKGIIPREGTELFLIDQRYERCY